MQPDCIRELIRKNRIFYEVGSMYGYPKRKTVLDIFTH